MPGTNTRLAPVATRVPAIVTMLVTASVSTSPTSAGMRPWSVPRKMSLAPPHTT